MSHSFIAPAVITSLLVLVVLARSRFAPHSCKALPRGSAIGQSVSKSRSCSRRSRASAASSRGSVPAALWLVATGDVTRGVILALYGALIVSTIDNLVRPLLSRRGLSIHPLLVFLSLFGGLAAFGMAGLYLGPLFVALFVSVVRIYEREIAPAATQGTVEIVIPADTSLSYRLAQALSSRLKRGKPGEEGERERDKGKKGE